MSRWGLRPALLIEPVTVEQEAISAAAVRRTVYFTLTVYDETDDYAQTDSGALLALQELVLELFRPGYLRVGDRALAVTASTGGRDWDKAFVDIQLTYHDLRGTSSSTEPVMEAVRVDLKNETKG